MAFDAPSFVEEGTVWRCREFGGGDRCSKFIPWRSVGCRPRLFFFVIRWTLSLKIFVFKSKLGSFFFLNRCTNRYSSRGFLTRRVAVRTTTNRVFHRSTDERPSRKGISEPSHWRQSRTLMSSFILVSLIRSPSSFPRWSCGFRRGLLL